MSKPLSSLMRWAMLAMSVEVARRSTPVAGSTTLGAELPVTTTGPQSGIVRSYCGSRPRKVKLVGQACMYLPTTSGGRVVSQDADVLENPQRRFVDPFDLLGGE